MKVGGAIVLAAALSALVVGCAEEARPAAPAPAPPAPTPTHAAPVPESPPEGTPAPPIDELSEPELEAACFRGRQEACDQLGH